MRTVFFDLETAGLGVDDAIIQFAAVAVDEQWKEVEALEVKLKFDVSRADASALAVNRYSEERWANAVEQRAAVLKIEAFLRRYADVQMKGKNPPFRSYSVARMGGHNIVGFDLERLGRLFKRQGVFFPCAFGSNLDTLQGAVWYFAMAKEAPKPKDHKLVTLCQHFGIDVTDAHDALADVRMSVGLAAKLAEVFSFRQQPSMRLPSGENAVCRTCGGQLTEDACATCGRVQR